MSAARAEILRRIRAATLDVAPSEPAAWTGPADYARALDLDRAAVVELFAERVADYRAQVVRCSGDDEAIAAAIAAAAAGHGARLLVAPADLAPAWLPAGAVDALVDDPEAPLDVDALDAADGVVTASALGIAQTGTLVLDCGPGQGRRALTLVPDLHICVVRAAEVVGTVPEAFDRLDEAGREGRPITFVSGPSATSDIELNRVEGVHGPRRLVVVLAG
ncbi:MAG: L-lactate dehydrogenase complex protein LldG [Thermoleophilales bacterium]|nr:L-lactate dehydrogenase complex protein LldG [Thermoleophilales bacterium]